MFSCFLPRKVERVEFKENDYSFIMCQKERLSLEHDSKQINIKNITVTEAPKPVSIWDTPPDPEFDNFKEQAFPLHSPQSFQKT